jgi:hypothetical protein
MNQYIPAVVGGLVGLAGVLSINILSAHIIYNDWRCAFVECRIEVQQMYKGERE